MEHISINRDQYTTVYGINGYSVKITKSCRKNSSAPLVLLCKNDKAFIHNVKVEEKSSDIIVLSFEINEDNVWLYDIHKNSISFASDSTSADSNTLPEYIVTFEIINPYNDYSIAFHSADKHFNSTFLSRII